MFDLGSFTVTQLISMLASALGTHSDLKLDKPLGSLAPIEAGLVGKEVTKLLIGTDDSTSSSVEDCWNQCANANLLVDFVCPACGSYEVVNIKSINPLGVQNVSED